MTEYALLVLPSANRVYGASSPALARAELSWLARQCFDTRVRDIASATFGGVDYVEFRTDAALTQSQTDMILNSSTCFALFERLSDSSLRPLDGNKWATFDDDLVTIQRYAGKTNEQFTHLLVNLALAASATGFERVAEGTTLRLLDPVCGRGSTLNRALLYGMDVAGIDTDRRDIDAYALFLRTYLKDKRIRFDESTGVVRKGGRLSGARTLNLRIRGADREQRADIIVDDTTRAVDHFGRSSFDLIVGDLPYGVRHGAQSEATLRRSPLALVHAAASGWAAALKSTGALALAWNIRLVDRPTMTAALVDAGLDVVDASPGPSFEHRVDRTITRDVVVATRPKQNG
jgi:hypothetical protein